VDVVAEDSMYVIALIVSMFSAESTYFVVYKDACLCQPVYFATHPNSDAFIVNYFLEIIFFGYIGNVDRGTRICSNSFISVPR